LSSGKGRSSLVLSCLGRNSGEKETQVVAIAALGWVSARTIPRWERGGISETAGMGEISDIVF